MFITFYITNECTALFTVDIYSKCFNKHLNLKGTIYQQYNSIAQNLWASYKQVSFPATQMVCLQDTVHKTMKLEWICFGNVMNLFEWKPVLFHI